MLERIKAVLDARKENDKGFSLVELAVVIVIIGILVAVAIPIFLNMQTSAEQAAVEAAAANGAAMVAADIASDADSVGSKLTELESDTISVTHNGKNTIDDYCVRASSTTAGVDDVDKGPGTCVSASAGD